MPATARALIVKAYYLSGIVSRKFQIVSGDQITDGLALLNDALATEGISGSLIPYYQEYSFNAVPAQESYFIPGLIEPESLTFNIGSVRYSMEYKQRRKYFGTSRADNIQSLPYEWHIERKLNGADLYMFFLPNTNYPLKLWGKFKLDDITDLCADLELIYDKYFIKYLTYALAREIADEWGMPLPVETSKELARLEEKLTYVSPMDLTTKKQSVFRTGDQINYGYANLGTGWLP